MSRGKPNRFLAPPTPALLGASLGLILPGFPPPQDLGSKVAAMLRQDEDEAAARRPFGRGPGSGQRGEGVKERVCGRYKGAGQDFTVLRNWRGLTGRLLKILTYGSATRVLIPSQSRFL
jgi:hypothetical protein